MAETGYPLPRRGFLTLAGCATLAVAVPMPALARGASGVQTLSGNAFGTGWRIGLPDNVDAAALGGPIGALLAGIDRQMSPYRADSDLTRVNSAGRGRYAVPPETAHVAAAAMALAATSDGAFDPSVGPLVARWGFGPIKGDPRPDWSDLSVEAGAVEKARAGVTLDLCGIAKGYALGRLAALLEQADLQAFLIDLGGELIARGHHPSGRPWRVGVEDPRPDSAGLAEVLQLDGIAVATSGNRENGYSHGARRYSHIIDPATRQPVVGNLASVSVLGPDAMVADGWATALMAAGSTAGPVLARRQNLSALFLFSDGAGLHRIATGDFDRHLA